MKGINIFLADGFEDIEALGTNDVLRRAGLETNLISVNFDPMVESSHGVLINSDEMFTLSDYLETDHEGTYSQDFMIFPGGMPGSKTLAENKALMKLMNDHYAAGGSVAAICAAPGLVLSQLECPELSGLEFTCFDGFESHLIEKGAQFTPKPAVACGRIITGRSAGHCLSFGLEIVKAIEGEELAARVQHALYLN